MLGVERRCDDGDRSPRRLFFGNKAQAAPASRFLGGDSELLIIGNYRICFINVDRLTGCLRSFVRPVEAMSPPPKGTAIRLGGGL